MSSSETAISGYCGGGRQAERFFLIFPDFLIFLISEMLSQENVQGITMEHSTLCSRGLNHAAQKLTVCYSSNQPFDKSFLLKSFSPYFNSKRNFCFRYWCLLKASRLNVCLIF